MISPNVGDVGATGLRAARGGVVVGCAVLTLSLESVIGGERGREKGRQRVAKIER